MKKTLQELYKELSSLMQEREDTVKKIAELQIKEKSSQQAISSQIKRICLLEEFIQKR